MTSPHARALKAAAVRYRAGGVAVYEGRDTFISCHADANAAQAEADRLNLAAVQALVEEREEGVRKALERAADILGRPSGPPLRPGEYVRHECTVDAHTLHLIDIALATLTGEGDDVQ